MKFAMGRRTVIAAAAAAVTLGSPVFAAGHQVVEKLHFLIPGGAGGWMGRHSTWHR